MNEELFRNKLMISSPTSISLGHITWFALDTKLVGRVKALLEERNNLQSKIDKANKILDKYAKTEVEDYNEIIKFYKELRNVLKEDK